MYRRCGVDPQDDILAALNDLPLDHDKWKILHQIEDEAAKTMKIMPGAVEIINWLKLHDLPIAIVTRNTRQSVKALEQQLMGDGCTFDTIVARDSPRGIPPKPDPAALHYIAKQWNAPTENLFMIGDSYENDIVAAKRAGAITALLVTDDTDTTKHSEQADIRVQHLHEVPYQLFQAMEFASEAAQPLKKFDVPKPTSVTSKAAADGNMDNLINIHQIDETANTPLLWAVEFGQIEVVSYLLGQNVNVNHRGYLGATPACRAARRGHADILTLLAKAGADLNIANNKFQSPLHFAAFKENVDCVKVLLDHGANTGALDRKGRTPHMDTSNDAIKQLILNTMI
jgi:HAD superfamily hydrolase (TIGR01549 family)